MSAVIVDLPRVRRALTALDQIAAAGPAPSPDSGKSRDKAAAVVNVSHGSIDNASRVIEANHSGLWSALA
jgi:hypothetical protein